MLTFLFLLAAQAPATDEMTKLVPAIQAGMEKFVPEARKLSGTVSISDVTEAKKLLSGHIVKTDGPRYIVQDTGANQKPTKVELYRAFGDIRQGIIMTPDRSGVMQIRDQLFRKKSEPAFDFEDVRVFAYDAPACIPLRPVPSINKTILDFLDYPAFEITKIENTTIDKEKVVKISYQVNKDKNKLQDSDERLNSIISGWVAFRPQQLWTVYRAEYQLPGDRRRPARSWKADYVYESTPGAFPVIKEIRLSTTDQQADKPDLKLSKQLYEFALKPAKEPFTDQDFSMAQFGVKEKTASDWLVEVAAKEKAEADEQARIAALPPGATKPASSGLNIDPWVVLIGGVAAFIILVMWVFWKTSKPVRPTLPQA